MAVGKFQLVYPNPEFVDTCKAYGKVQIENKIPVCVVRNPEAFDLLSKEIENMEGDYGVKLSRGWKDVLFLKKGAEVEIEDRIKVSRSIVDSLKTICEGFGGEAVDIDNGIVCLSPGEGATEAFTTAVSAVDQPVKVIIKY